MAIPDPVVVTRGTSLLPDKIALKLFGFCCANIVVVRPAVATPSISSVATVVHKNTSVLIFVPKVELSN